MRLSKVGLKRVSVVPNKKELGQRGRGFENTFLFQPTIDLLRTICVIGEIEPRVDAISLLW